MKRKIETDPRTYAEYVIGQTMNFMVKGSGAIHDMCWSWGENYFTKFNRNI